MSMRVLVVDDRADQRTDLCEAISLNLPEGVEITAEDVFPFEDLGEYASYIQEHDISVLLLDERLNEKKDIESGRHVAYFGHDVLKGLRASLPDFPVYVVTTHPTDTDLVANDSEVEDVIDRTDFIRSTEKYLSRIHRAASRFLESKGRHLEALDHLTTKAALGDLSASEQQELTRIRALLGLPFTNDAELVSSDLIAHARKLAEDSEELLRKLRSGSKS